MKKLFLILAMATLAMPSYSQVKSVINSRLGRINQIKAYGFVSYKGLNYYPIGHDSLLVQGSIYLTDSVIIPPILTIDRKPYRITGFRPSAFEHNNDLKYVSIPNTVTEIESSAFFACKRLKECDMPSVQCIGGSAFTSTAFERIVFPDSLKYIQTGAFCSCYQLRYIELPAGLLYVGDRAFLNTGQLDTVKVHFTQPIEVGSDAFQYVPNRGIPRPITLMVPAGSKQAFEQAETWKDFRPIIEY